jgi:sulfoxide reductase heme-binding subunit YedZ
LTTRATVRGLKVLLWVSALLPFTWIVVGAFLGWLGVNPIEKITHVTGLTALTLLLITLTVTPFRRISGWNPIVQLRRPLGLFAFFYACIHFMIWMALDLGFQLAWIWEDIMERPYITVGFSAFLLLTPLAVTSTKGWIRRLGRRWTSLHRLVYVAATLGVIHFYWLVKSDTRLPVVYAGAFLFLLALRVPDWTRRRGARRAERSPPEPASPVGSGRAA